MFNKKEMYMMVNNYDNTEEIIEDNSKEIIDDYSEMDEDHDVIDIVAHISTKTLSSRAKPGPGTDYGWSKYNMKKIARKMAN